MMNDCDEIQPSVEFVSMPWNDPSELVILPGQKVKRWHFIQMQLSLERSITNVNDLIETIKSYNTCEGRENEGKYWRFLALKQYFKEINEFEKKIFFMQGGLLETIRNLCLQGAQLVSRVRLLKSGSKTCVTLHQVQIASLLANAFLCTYPKRDTSYPSINFNKLFEGIEKGNIKPFIEKIKCIIHYFKRIQEKQPIGIVSFHRLCIVDNKIPRWDKTTARLSSLRVETEGKIEDQVGFLQMDFANRFVGGGVLGRGSVQEEIRFIICPELIAARLFTQCLADNEALFVVGAERYCKYTGYADTFTFDGDFRDATPYDESQHRKTYMIVLDALQFHHPSEQYRESRILRELKKAYVGFMPIPKTPALPLATGNWGCGAFRGDPQLKSILQLMASSQAQRDILYLTFGDTLLKKQIDDLYGLMKKKDITVGTLYRIIRLFSRNKDADQSLFGFIQDTIINCDKSSSTGTGTGHRPTSEKIEPTVDLVLEEDLEGRSPEESKTPVRQCSVVEKEMLDADARSTYSNAGHGPSESDSEFFQRNRHPFIENGEIGDRSQTDFPRVRGTKAKKLVQAKITDFCKTKS